MTKLIKAGVVLAMFALIALGYAWFAPGPLNEARTVTIREGSTLMSAAADLKDAGAISDVRRFYYLGRLLGGGSAIQAGEFEIPAHSSPSAILDLLQHGRPVQRLITVSEGMPAIIVAEKLAAVPYLTGPVPDIAEGSVLPDSYGYDRGEARSNVVGRMQAAMDKKLKRLWADRKGDCPVATPAEAVILASIVEKETGKASERPTIAGVYCNRLKIGMKLDADPTVIYPVTKGKPLGRRILRSELNAITGYNTYREPGLPDGPITNPGKESIAAVLNPAPTKALYFVADGSGGHVFAETLAQHQANVAKWFKLRRQRGEM